MEKSMSKAELSKEMRTSSTVQPSNCGNGKAPINYQRLLVGYLKVCMLKTLFMSLTLVFNHVTLAFDCFFHDVVLAKVLDEATTTSLNSIIHSNNAIDDSTFIQELFARLRSFTISAESKKNLVSQLPNKKETIYRVLDKWVPWETEFPLIASAKALQIFKKRSQWLRVIQLYSITLKLNVVEYEENLVRELCRKKRTDHAATSGDMANIVTVLAVVPSPLGSPLGSLPPPRPLIGDTFGSIVDHGPPRGSMRFISTGAVFESKHTSAAISDLIASVSNLTTTVTNLTTTTVFNITGGGQPIGDLLKALVG
ncbi:hypothetical protein J1N35_021524 [Gossypium stocksii]|uniref:Serine/threonine-protein phosphatase 4 regulatory subunit 3-like central domain-containing protein n=1 Tax=Gossypium stocksii TaxID=47602 RepID=A0A9D3VEW6_9ROSI|nr:hypothetical protein J1N35_021524 [Gossypium stocksii]